MPTIDQLKWASLTAAINEIKSPNQFLKRFLWSRHRPVNTEDIELSILDKGREIAPFVRKNGEGIMVAGHSETFQTVTAPNIRIKRPFTPSELLYNRRPGTVVFPTRGQQQSAIDAHIARDLQIMSDYITNAEEWLCAQALTGTIAYEIADEEVFTITFPRPAATQITLSTFWDDATPSNTRPLQDIHSAKRVLADEAGLGITDAICGTEAVDALMELVETGNIKMLGTDGASVRAGDFTFAEQFTDDGVIFLGTIAGVRFWEYSRQATHPDGTTADMIRPKYVEFVSRSPASERVLYYGAIPDMKTLRGQRFVGERFSKSWEEEDPSAQMSLAHSRPLPVPRRAGAWVSMKVVSG